MCVLLTQFRVIILCLIQCKLSKADKTHQRERDTQSLQPIAGCALAQFFTNCKKLRIEMMSCSLQLYVGWLLLMAVVAINAAPTADSTHNLEVGSCSHPDQRIYTDNTIVENGGPSTLNGTLEVSLICVKRVECFLIF